MHPDKCRRLFAVTALPALLSLALVTASEGDVVVSGELKQWHKVTLTLEGPTLSETGTPNPFTDHRLNVTFTNGAATLVVPGYFAADGNAAETSATSGNKWRVHFSPDEPGTWSYTVSFRQGTNVAVDPSPIAGTAVAPLDGVTGSFEVSATDKTGRDLRGKGRLRYVGKHHLRFAGTGGYFSSRASTRPKTCSTTTHSTTRRTSGASSTSAT
jgi:hypothetical protein